MSYLEWLLWGAIAWAVFMTFCAVDVPSLVARMRGHR